MVMPAMLPSASRSSSVFSSKSRVSTTAVALNSMYSVSVSWKYLIFIMSSRLERSIEKRIMHGLAIWQQNDPQILPAHGGDSSPSPDASVLLDDLANGPRQSSRRWRRSLSPPLVDL